MQSISRYQHNPLVLFLGSALDVMRREACLSGELETGGTLLGVILGWLILVTHATAPGPRARHRAAMFEADIPYQQEELDRITYRYGGVRYVGEWHKHPSGLHRPSGVDAGGVREILNDPDYDVEQLLFPIVTCDRRSGFEIHPYLMARGWSDFASLKWEELPLWLDADLCFDQDAGSLFTDPEDESNRPSGLDVIKKLFWRQRHV